jgi:hypothetical protein
MEHTLASSSAHLESAEQVFKTRKDSDRGETAERERETNSG